MIKISLLFSLFIITNLVYSQTLEEGLSSLSAQISAGMTESNKQKIAVIEFSDLNGNITELGKFLSEELITRLFLTKKFQVIERQLLNKVLSEHKLNTTGVIDETTAKELGNILGVEAIVSGTIADLGETVKINSRLISTETGQIFSVASEEIVKDNTLKRLMGIYISGESNVRKKSTVSEDIFFKEDFSDYEVGDIASDWGPNVVVKERTSGEKNIETLTGTTTLRHDINFPQNFLFEFDLYGKPSWPNSDAEPLVFIDNNGEELLIDISTFYDNSSITLGGIRSSSFKDAAKYKKWNTIKVLVKDSIIKVYLNGVFIVSGNFPQYSDFVRIKFTTWSKRSLKNFIGRILY